MRAQQKSRFNRNDFHNDDFDVEGNEKQALTPLQQRRTEVIEALFHYYLEEYEVTRDRKRGRIVWRRLDDAKQFVTDETYKDLLHMFRMEHRPDFDPIATLEDCLAAATTESE